MLPYPFDHGGIHRQLRFSSIVSIGRQSNPPNAEVLP